MTAMQTRFIFVFAVLHLFSVRSSIVLVTERSDEIGMWPGACEMEQTAVLLLDTSSNFTESVKLDVFVASSGTQLIKSGLLVSSGYNVLSLPKSLFTGSKDMITLHYATQSNSQWNVSILMNPTISNVEVSYSDAMIIDKESNISASVQTGRGVSFIFTIEKLVNDTMQLEQISIVHPPDYYTVAATIQFVPTESTLYTVNVTAIMGSEIQEAAIQSTAGYPIPAGTLALGPNCTNHGGHHFPGDVINIIITVTDRADSQEPLSANCTISWGDNTVLNEVDVNLQTDVATGIMYSRSHSYQSYSNFSISVRCYSLINEVKGKLYVTIDSVLEHADAHLLERIVPFFATTLNAKAFLRITHPDLTADFPYLNISVDFGLSNSKQFLYFTYPLQAIEQLYTQKGNYKLSVIFESFGFTKQIDLDLRVGVIDFYISNQPRVVLVNEQQVFEIVRFTKSEKWDVNLNYDGGSETKTFPIGLDRLYVNYTYKNTGLKKAMASVNVNNVMEEAVFAFTVYAGCIGNTDLFEVTHRNDLTPLSVLIPEVPAIAGRVERSALCSRTDYFLFYWQLSINIGRAPCYEWDPVNITQPGKVNFILKHFIDQPGLYRLMLNVTSPNNNLTVSDYILLQVIQPFIVADIQLGTIIQHSIGKSLILDAESLSYSSLAVTPEQSNLAFSWTCFMLMSKLDILEVTEIYKHNKTYISKSPCSLPVLQNQGRISVPTKDFTDGDLILFEVTAQKHGLEDTAVLVVEMLHAQLPVVALVCVWNCGAKLVTGERTVLTTTIECPECSSRDLHYPQKYQWSLFKLEPKTGHYENVSWNQRINSGPNSELFDSEGGWWEPGEKYMVTVIVEVGSLPAVTTSRVFFTNLPAYNGTCFVKPQQGIAGETKFTFSFPGWKDENNRPSRNSTLDHDGDGALLYQVQQRAAVETPAIYSGAQISTDQIILPACATENNYCNVDIIVSDLFNAKSTCTVTVKVSYYTQLSANASEEQQLQTVLQSIDNIKENMSYTIQMGNSVKIAHEAATYSTMLNSLDRAFSTEPEVTYFATANITSVDALSFLLNPVAKIKPARNALTMATDHLVTNIDHALQMDVDNDLIDVNHLVTFEKALVTVTSSTYLLSGQSLQKVSATAARISDMLVAQASDLRVMNDVEECLKANVQLLSNVLEAEAVNVKSSDHDPSIVEDSSLSNHERTYMFSLLARRRDYSAAPILKHAPEIAANVMDSWQNLFGVCHKLEHYNGSYEVKSEVFSAAVQKTTREDILKQNTAVGDKSVVNSFSFSDVAVEDNFTDIHIQVLRSRNNFLYGTNSKLITSDIFIASVVTENSTKLNMIAPRIVHDFGVENCSARKNLQVVTPNFTFGDAAYLFYHSFDYQDINARACITVKPTESFIIYRLYVKVGSEPTDIIYDYRVTLSSEILQSCNETCIPSEKLKKTGKVFIGLRPFLNKYTTSGRIKRQAVVNPLLSRYMIGITIVACYNWDAERVAWESSLCKISRGNGTVICTCSDGPELINALSFSFAPNTIHFPTVFSRFDIQAQGEVIGILLTIYFIFALVSMWAHYKDRKGIFQWGVFPLVDNYADEDYFYLITVHTGLRKSAGTKSKVSFCLTGDLDETGVRELTDGIREGFPTASVLHFVMACPASLGPLQCLRIWHDNSGKGKNASWYLDQVDVTDIQTGYTHFFVCGEWLTPENSTLDKIIESSSVKDMQTLKSLLVFNTKKRITDEHMWISVVIRPEMSRFSRMERVGCCLVFLLLAMLTNAMFYRGALDNDRKRPPSDLQIGPLRLSIQQLYNSLVSAVITAIPIAVIVMIFRRARVHADKDDWSCGRCRKKGSKITGDLKAVKSTKSCCSKLPWMVKLERQLSELEKILLLKPDAEELKGTWSSFWRYVAWVLVFITAAVCSFFVILYTMEWGQDVTEEWLSTFFLSFLQSMFVVDPFKVIFISFLLSVFVRKTKGKGLHELNLKLILQVNKEYGIKNKKDLPREFVSYASVLSEAELKAATRKRNIHIMIRNTLWELAVHCFFLIIICSLCYSSRSTHDYQLHAKIYTDLVHHKDAGFNSVKSYNQYFDWLENIMVPWLFPEKDYLGQSIVSEDRQFTKVWSLYRLGAPRLRQVRMKKGDCIYSDIDTKPCIDKYSISQEETSQFCLGWSKTPCLQTDQLHVTFGAWYHTSAASIVGLPIVGEYNTYGGGGYILNLDINLLVAKAIIQEIKQYLWIDQQTRAVFLEFTAYCPNVNRFAYIVLLAEFLETGGITTKVSIYPFTVYSPPGSLGTYFTICGALYICFSTFGLLYVVFILSKEKWAAFKNLWFMVDFAAVIGAIIAVSMYNLRLSSAKTALSKMKEDRTQFMNFHHVVLWDRGFIACLGFLIAIAFFRLLKLAGYSERTMRIYHVLRLAVDVLPSFFTYISLIMMSFVFLGYVLFSHTSYNFRSFMTTMVTLFTGILGHSGFKETNLPESDQWETILFFCLFLIICVVFLTNLFLAVLLDILTLTAQKDCDAVKSDEAQIFTLLWNSILKKLRLKRDPVHKQYQES